jgi:hypothetical protein
MRWEYKTFAFKKRRFFSGSVNVEALSQELESLGRDGWELVSVCPNSFMGAPNGLIVALKRAK